MDELSSDDSLDDYCSSYATFAKKTYEAAVERASKALVNEEEDILLDGSFVDSEKGKRLGNENLSDISTIGSEKETSRKNAVRRRKRPANTRTRNKSRLMEGEDEDSITLSSGSDWMDSLIEIRSSPITVEGQKELRSREKKVKETLTILSSDEDILSPEIKKRPCTEANELMSVKILWKYTKPIQKLQLRKYQKFQSILEHFAKMEGVPMEQIVLYGGKDHMRSIEPYDTPDSIGYTITDILEGGILSKDSVKQSGLAKRYRDASETDGEEIELRVQLEQIRSFPLLIRKEQKMGILIVKVAEQLETEVDRVKLLLDGEAIDLESTPQDLDLEDGDVLDVLLSNPPAKTAKSPVKPAKSSVKPAKSPAKPAKSPASSSRKLPRRRCRN